MADAAGTNTSPGGLVVGASPIANGTGGLFLYDNNGVLGEIAASAIGSITLGSTAMSIGGTYTTIAGSITWTGVNTYSNGILFPASTTNVPVRASGPFTGSTIARFTPDDGPAPFLIGQLGFDNPGDPTRKDQQFTLGYNYIPGAGRATTSDVGFGFALESYYAPTAIVQREIYWELVGGLGGVKRPWGMAWRSDTGNVTVAYEADTHTLSSSSGTAWININSSQMSLDSISLTVPGGSITTNNNVIAGGSSNRLGTLTFLSPNTVANEISSDGNAKGVLALSDDRTALGNGPFLTFVTRLTSAPTYTRTAGIFGPKQNSTSGDNQGMLSFWTNPGSTTTSTTERLRLDSTGNAVVAAAGSIGFNSTTLGSGAQDVFCTRGGTATLQLGAANAASPVAQTLQAQGSRSGTDSNVGGGNITVQPGQGTGTGTLSSLAINSPLAGANATAAQTLTRTLVANRSSVAVGPGVNVSTSATDGFFYFPQCLGTATGTPTAQGTTAAAIIDATNSRLFVNVGGAWKSVALA